MLTFVQPYNWLAGVVCGQRLLVGLWPCGGWGPVAGAGRPLSWWLRHIILSALCYCGAGEGGGEAVDGDNRFLCFVPLSALFFLHTC